MPKERTHLILAEAYLGLSALSGGAVSIEVPRQSFLFGSICPDIFFYDFPFFSLQSTGTSFHKIDVATLALSMATESSGRFTVQQRAWLMGIGCHFIVDSVWHPIINSMSGSIACARHGVGARGCHHLVESELDAWWVRRRGPADGYSSLLREFTRVSFRNAHSGIYRELLKMCHISTAPSLSRIGRCMLLQSVILGFLTGPTMGRWRDALLSNRLTRGLGTLVAPSTPRLIDSMGGLNKEGVGEDPFSDDLLDKTVAMLSARMSGIEAPWQ